MRSLGTLSILTRRCVNPNAERLVFGSVSFTAARSVVLSVITGGGKWLMIKAHADPLYQHLIVTAERKFWRCVESGEPPRLFGVEPPRPKIEAVRVVDMGASNAWAEFAGVFARTKAAHAEHEQAKAELRSLMPEDAKEAVGHGIRARRSKSGAVSFDLVAEEDIPSDPHSFGLRQSPHRQCFRRADVRPNLAGRGQ